MKKLAFAGALLLALTSAANATNHCTLREYVQLPFVQGYLGQLAQEAGTDQAILDITSGAATSAAVASTTQYVRLWCSVQAAYVAGTNPTATTANSGIGAGFAEYFAVPANLNFKVSVIANP